MGFTGESNDKFERLESIIKQYGSLAVAFSGGVDSTLLLAVAKKVLGNNVIAVMNADAGVPERELKEAKRFCEERGIRLVLCDTDPLGIREYRFNSPDRCYYCKRAIFERIIGVAAENGISVVAEGSNVDDEGDYRPGLRAIAELGIKSPLREAGLKKSEIREISKELGLATFDKPSYACLASRFAYGEEITKEKLKMIDLAEQFLIDLGFTKERVRLHGDVARIEVDPSCVVRIASEEIRNRIYDRFKEIGFGYVSLDLKGYRVGSMNDAIGKATEGKTESMSDTVKTEIMNDTKAEKQELLREICTGERALFMAHDMKISETIFCDGESPLKHSCNIDIERSSFRWKYPLWYSKNIVLRDCVLEDTARAGIWYTDDLDAERVIVAGPKNFRRSSHIRLKNVTFYNALETFWECKDIVMEKVRAKGDYFAMNSKNLTLTDFELDGNYGFDGCENLTIENGRLLTKDAFWNCKNVLVRNSYICGEYLGWNSANVTFENCTIESLQGLCFIKNLVMRNCRLINTTLAFEYSQVDAEIIGHVDSIKNPLSGKITVGSVGELIMEEDKVDVGATSINIG